MSPLWLAILGIIFIVIATYIVIAKILPLIRALLDGLISGRALAGFMSLLIVVVYILAFSKIVSLLVSVEGNQYLGYLNLIIPGINILEGILPYIKYVLLGALIAWGFKSCKR